MCNSLLEDNDVFQSTLPVWGATSSLHAGILVSWISIHAPRVGSDRLPQTWHCPTTDFNPRSPCGERLQAPEIIRRTLYISIHAPRVGSDATPTSIKSIPQTYFNPRSPCGERLDGHGSIHVKALISIHAPRVGSDGWGIALQGYSQVFQSTLPVWGATYERPGV